MSEPTASETDIISSPDSHLVQPLQNPYLLTDQNDTYYCLGYPNVYLIQKILHCSELLESPNYISIQTIGFNTVLGVRPKPHSRILHHPEFLQFPAYLSLQTILHTVSFNRCNTVQNTSVQNPYRSPASPDLHLTSHHTVTDIFSFCNYLFSINTNYAYYYYCHYFYIYVFIYFCFPVLTLLKKLKSKYSVV